MVDCASWRPVSTALCCARAVALEAGDHVAEPLHLGHEPLDPLVEGVAAQVEQAGAARHRVAQLLPGQLGGHVGGRAHGVLALHAEAGLELGGLLGEEAACCSRAAVTRSSAAWPPARAARVPIT